MKRFISLNEREFSYALKNDSNEDSKTENHPIRNFFLNIILIGLVICLSLIIYATYFGSIWLFSKGFDADHMFKITFGILILVIISLRFKGWDFLGDLIASI